MNYLNDIEDEIKGLGFEIIQKDFERPWGGFLVIDERQSQEFTNRFFNGIHVKNLKISGKLSPKILIIKPNSKLSWQYHQRRAEIWKVIRGEVGAIKSKSNNQNEKKILNEEDIFRKYKRERNRIIGLDN